MHLLSDESRQFCGVVNNLVMRRSMKNELGPAFSYATASIGEASAISWSSELDTQII